VAHQFLNDERSIGPVTASEYAILDALLDEAKDRLHPLPADIDDNEAYERFAADSLQVMDCILVRHGFVYPGIGLVQLLSDGLDPTTFTDPRYYQALLESPHNSGRISFIELRKPGPYYVVDCDIASYLYLAMGEVMKYPLFLVQMPLHNFIRWQRPRGGYIDFETMDGKETNDDYYAAIWGIPKTFIGVSGVLTTMNSEQLLAYEHFGIAISYTWKHDYTNAISEYERAISIDATLSESENNLAWLYTVVPDTTLRNGPKAVVHGENAAAILADSDVLDTLACAYGLAGDASRAVATEDRAIQVHWAPQGSDLSKDLALLSAGNTCEDSTFGMDPHPFRPSSQTLSPAHIRDVLH
jgi:tetratricopeptide (TPR) repeat protein